MKPSQNRDNLRWKIDNTTFVCGLLAFFFNNFVDVLLRLLYDALNFGRLNTAVKDEVFKSDTGDLSANRVKRRDGDSARRIIHYYFNTCYALKCLYVASFFSDNFSFDFIIRDIDSGC